MELLAARQKPSFYCNRCDKWVDGIEDAQNSSDPQGILQVLCDECGTAIRYRPPSFWKSLQRKAFEAFTSVFSKRKE